MNKVGILTFHNSYNCGSILQAYALQQILLLKYKLNPEIIDFYNSGSVEKYSLFIKDKNFKNIIKNFLYFYNFKILKKDYWDYEPFIKNNLLISNKSYHCLQDLYDIEKNYDMFICGSDQIWNITCMDADDSYFLPFVKNKKKIAYSPSLGAKSISKYADDIKKYSNYINSFDYLSVRERNGKKWLSELTDKEIKIVPDPTLLLNESDYLKILEPSGITGEYIFYYSYGYDEEEDKIVDFIAKKLKLPVYIFNGKRYSTLKFKYKSFHIPKKENPGIFLDLIKNSKYIFTSSFHGTVFSTIFRKKFFVFKNSGMINGDDRASFLLEQLGLLDRFISIDEQFDFDSLNNNIDYDIVKNNILELQKNAFEYLDLAIKDDLHE